MDFVYAVCIDKLDQDLAIHDEFGDIAEREEVLFVIVQEEHKEYNHRFIVGGIKILLCCVQRGWRAF